PPRTLTSLQSDWTTIPINVSLLAFIYPFCTIIGLMIVPPKGPGIPVLAFTLMRGLFGENAVGILVSSTVISGLSRTHPSAALSENDAFRRRQRINFVFVDAKDSIPAIMWSVSIEQSTAPPPTVLTQSYCHCV